MSSTEGNSVSSLGEELLAPDAEVRRLAAVRLPALDATSAAALLLLALSDGDWRVRKDATLAGQELLAAAGDRGDAGGEALLLEALVEALGPGENVGLRNAAIEVLAGHGRAAIGVIASAYEKLDADGRKLAVEALGRTGDAAALEALTRALADQDDNVRHAAVEAIAALGPGAPEPVIEVLTEALGDNDRLVQLTALHGLNALEAAAPWARIMPLLSDPMLRPAALEAAALAESPEAPAALVGALPSGRGRAFAQIVGALSRLTGGPLAVHVVEALRTAGPEVGARLARAAADPARQDASAMAEPPSWGSGPSSGAIGLRGQALVLAALADAPSAVEAAIDALAEPALAEPAQRALMSLGRRALGEVLERLRAHVGGRAGAGVGAEHAASESPLEPEQAAALLDVAVALVGEDPARMEEVHAVVRGALSSPSTLLATAAVYALAKLGREEDLRLTAEQSVEAPLPVACAAERALAALADRHPDAARSLAREMMHDPSRYLPAAVVLEALGAAHVAGVAAVPELVSGMAPGGAWRRASISLEVDELSFLVHAAATGDARARCAAVSASVSVSGADALELLAAALADEEREVQLAAARALGRLRAALDPAAAPAIASRTEELLDLLGQSGDAELVAAASSGPAGAEERDPGRALSSWGTPGDGSSLP
ncbi:HEAT repeat domain-containing protein [Chondromyces apiculatus]|uniref:HEAT repeat protein n=1 Tax=Chondromyces apiculatus DSM 436 TaxID=1192034 RepID=A0A017STM4_9BACT|nr:HEAT repeat domain-containing protein [Chondromyces apiculatus]EYF00348.1 Hypothetical protein CAP_0920 [Chondromyces apiculatus DSM 436]